MVEMINTDVTWHYFIITVVPSISILLSVHQNMAERWFMALMTLTKGYFKVNVNCVTDWL